MQRWIFFPVENRVCQLTIDFESDFFDVLQLKYTEVGRPLKLQENAYLNASKVRMTCSYSTAQLQGNVQTRLKCVRDVPETRAGHVWDARKMRPCKHKTS